MDGFILYAIPEESSIIQRILGRQLPAVTVDMQRIPGVPAVILDDRGSARNIAHHVLQLGHKKITILSLDMRQDGIWGRVASSRLKQCNMVVTRERLLGYSDALADVGIDLRGVPIYEVRSGDEDQAYSQAIAFLEEKAARPTGIFAMSDRLALGAMRAATKLGLRVPEDVSVVGFDDIPQASASTPPLTTICQPKREKGFLAASILVGDLPYSEEARVLPTELVVRDSVAAPRQWTK
jgi:DNA-binding LacI/PurR family transcriptional regulator